MGDLTTNLSRHEFKCKCDKPEHEGYCAGNFEVADFLLVCILQECVDHFSEQSGRPVSIQITSGCRCRKHNKDVGGSKYSQHRYGRASDFRLFYKDNGAQINPDEVAHYLETRYPESLGIGKYNSWTHVDSRKSPARWDKRV